MLSVAPADVDALTGAADAYLDSCFRKETPPHAGELAALWGIAPHQLTHLFRRLLRRTPSAYLKERQIVRAQHLLRTGSLPMNVIAYGSGFGTRVTFYRAFRRATGITPARYRAGHKRK
jgi:transcriptional regulator GlxA family with amidase domain